MPHNECNKINICQRCGAQFKAKSRCKKYCGDPDEVGSCSYKVRQEQARKADRKRTRKQKVMKLSEHKRSVTPVYIPDYVHEKVMRMQ